MRFRTCRRPWEPMHQVLVAPFVRLRQDVEWGLPSALIAAGSAWADKSDLVLLGILVGLALTSVIDSGYGRLRARLAEARGEGKYDPIIAQMGMHAKIIGLILIGLLRGVEYLLSQIALDTHGAAAVIVGTVFLFRELRSIDGHRIAFGAGPVPALHQFLNLIEGIFARTFGQLPEQPRRRRGENGQAAGVAE